MGGSGAVVTKDSDREREQAKGNRKRPHQGSLALANRRHRTAHPRRSVARRPPPTTTLITVRTTTINKRLSISLMKLRRL